MTQPTSRRGATRRATAAEPVRRVWLRPFLAALAETSNVRKAAKAAGISTATVYDLKRRNRRFAHDWRAALCEGYDHLEMELLGRLREGEIKRAAGAKTGVRTFDNTTSFRQLAAHREEVLKERAQRANVSADDVRAQIERKVAALKARVLARQEAEAGDAAGD
jgi:transposase